MFLTDLKYINLNAISNHRPEYQLTAPLKYASVLLGSMDSLSEVFDFGVVTVPAGFKTDLASIPWPISKILKPNGPWKRAAVVHDYLCGQSVGLSAAKFPGLLRFVCDNVFLEAMKADGINAIVATVFWLYVRGFGIVLGRK